MTESFNTKGNFLETKNNFGQTVKALFKKAGCKLHFYQEESGQHEGDWYCEFSAFGVINIRFDITHFINSLLKKQ
jgi:hypothetical protein